VPDLTTKQQAFALEWLSNGYNGTAAYQKTYPGVTLGTAMTCASRLLRNAQVKRYITEAVENELGSLQMAAEKALGRLGLIATANIGMAFDERDQLRAPSAWPPPLLEAARGYDVRRRKLFLIDKLQALRTILELAGKLRNPVADSVDALAEAILADRERRERERAARERK